MTGVNGDARLRPVNVKMIRGKAISLMSKSKNTASAVFLFFSIVIMLGLIGYILLGISRELAFYLMGATAFAVWISCQQYQSNAVAPPAGERP
jgi:hypothetical protein